MPDEMQLARQNILGPLSISRLGMWLAGNGVQATSVDDTLPKADHSSSVQCEYEASPDQVVSYFRV